jgi:hypothetical protein
MAIPARRSVFRFISGPIGACGSNRPTPRLFRFERFPTLILAERLVAVRSSGAHEPARALDSRGLPLSSDRRGRTSAACNGYRCCRSRPASP